jgi:hypothetical protein
VSFLAYCLCPICGRAHQREVPATYAKRAATKFLSFACQKCMDAAQRPRNDQGKGVAK